MSKLQNKRCSIFKEPCLITGCAQYDERLDACIFNLMPFNTYKVSNAIEQLIQVMTNQAPQERYPTAQFRAR